MRMDKLQRISEVLHYIEEHLDEIASYEQVADIFCYSSYYFNRLFSAVVGKPIAAYIRERRLAKASILLTDPNKTITSICFECGFNSSQSFCRAFKRSYGISPSEYRSLGYTPVIMSVEEIIDKFTKKLKGGILVHPKIERTGNEHIAYSGLDAGEQELDVEKRLVKENLMFSYRSRYPYQCNDYLGWILKTKGPETRERRIAQMIEELRRGEQILRAP